MDKYSRNILIFILFTSVGLVLKKLQVTGAATLLIVAFSMLSFLFLLSGNNLIRLNRKASTSVFVYAFSYYTYSICSLAFLFQFNYWRYSPLLIWPALLLLAAETLLWLRFLISNVYDTHIRYTIIKNHVLPFLFFIFLIPFSALSSQRQFHNFFKGSTYESFIRKKYTENMARQLLEKNQCTDPSCLKEAQEVYHDGILNDSLKNYDLAFELYNKAIDLDIHLTEAYVCRASNRMLHATIDNELIMAALRDCSIAIDLKKDYAPAYLRRGFTNIFAHSPKQACLDFTKALALDPSLKIEKWINKTCGDTVMVK